MVVKHCKRLCDTIDRCKKMRWCESRICWDGFRQDRELRLNESKEPEIVNICNRNNNEGQSSHMMTYSFIRRSPIACGTISSILPGFGLACKSGSGRGSGLGSGLDNRKWTGISDL